MSSKVLTAASSTRIKTIGFCSPTGSSDGGRSSPARAKRRRTGGGELVSHGDCAVEPEAPPADPAPEGAARAFQTLRKYPALAKGWIESKLRILVKQLESASQSMVIHPYVTFYDFSEQDWPHGCACFIGLYFPKDQGAHTGQQIDCRGPVSQFVDVVGGWTEKDSYQGQFQLRAHLVDEAGVQQIQNAIKTHLEYHAHEVLHAYRGLHDYGCFHVDIKVANFMVNAKLANATDLANAHQYIFQLDPRDQYGVLMESGTLPHCPGSSGRCRRAREYPFMSRGHPQPSGRIC
eukprot:gene128-219_t